MIKNLLLVSCVHMCIFSENYKTLYPKIWREIQEFEANYKQQKKRLSSDFVLELKEKICYSNANQKDQSYGESKTTIKESISLI